MTKSKPKPAPVAKTKAKPATAKPAKTKAPPKPADRPHIDPVWKGKPPRGHDSTAIVRCVSCSNKHAMKDRRMFNGTHSECPKCGEGVHAGVDAETAAEKKAKPPAADVPRPFAVGDVVMVDLLPGPPRRGVVAGHDRKGNPSVRVAKVDRNGAYTGEMTKPTTYEPHAIGPVLRVVRSEPEPIVAPVVTPVPPAESRPADVLPPVNGTPANGTPVAFRSTPETRAARLREEEERLVGERGSHDGGPYNGTPVDGTPVTWDDVPLGAPAVSLGQAIKEIDKAWTDTAGFEPELDETEEAETEADEPEAKAPWE